MKPIAPPELIDSGIALFAPLQRNYRLIKLEIFYSKNNPIFSWVQCDNNEQRIWTTTVEQSENGTLFIYQTQGNLRIGFYNLVLTTYKSSGQRATGNCLIGVIDDRATLTIGLPYSAYPPIPIS